MEGVEWFLFFVLAFRFESQNIFEQSFCNIFHPFKSQNFSTKISNLFSTFQQKFLLLISIDALVSLPNVFLSEICIKASFASATCRDYTRNQIDSIKCKFLSLSFSSIATFSHQIQMKKKLKIHFNSWLHSDSLLYHR